MYTQKHLIGASDSGREGAIRSSARAILLCNGNLSTGDRNLAALLDFFRIPWKPVSIDEMTDERASAERDNVGGFCILSSARCMAVALQSLADRDADLPACILKADSVYLYGF